MIIVSEVRSRSNSYEVKVRGRKVPFRSGRVAPQSSEPQSLLQDLAWPTARVERSWKHIYEFEGSPDQGEVVVGRVVGGSSSTCLWVSRVKRHGGDPMHHTTRMRQL